MTTLYQALETARSYWEAKGPSSRMMPIRAQACAAALGFNQAKKLKLEELRPAHATTILAHLHRTKGKGSVGPYYAAFRRAVQLSGGDCRGWPKPGSAPRRCREPMTEDAINRLEAQLRAWDYQDTADLLELLRGTGMRVEREALGSECSWSSDQRFLTMVGKGGHMRTIPVERPETVALLDDRERMSKLRRLSYGGHLQRWNLAVERVGIKTLKPTPHAVRHYYATRAYERSGRNLRVVQELLGHADISTTARYLGVDVEAMREAVR